MSLSPDIVCGDRVPQNRESAILKGPNPYVFVVGCPRSGTTLLQRMLDSHPQLAVANDTHFIPLAIEETIPDVLAKIRDGLDPPLTPEHVECVLNNHRFVRLDLPEVAVRQAAAKAHTYGEFVSALYSEYGRARGKSLAGEKTPDYVRHLPLLHALFPWVRSVHILRDGRDVALSTLEWARLDKGPGRFALWQEEPVAVCALWWRWQVSAGRQDGLRLSPARYYELKYEDLVLQPEKNLRLLAVFLSLPFAPEMLAYHEGKVDFRSGLPAKKAWLPPTPGLRDWRTQMKAQDVELFEALAGDVLCDLGYERSVHTISPKIEALAERCRSRWESEVMSWQMSDEGRGARDEKRGSLISPPSVLVPRPGGNPRLSPADADLVQRDPALPGLATLLDPEALVADLQAAVPDFALGTAQITYLKYKPGTNCLVGYLLEVERTRVEIHAVAHRAEAQGKLQEARAHSGVSGVLGSGRIILADRAVIVSVFPNDRRINGLPYVAEAKALARLLREVVPDSPELWSGTVRTLVYKPERRYVGQLLVGQQAKAVLRLYYETGYYVRRNAPALTSRGPLRLSRRLGASDQHRLVVLDWLEGRPLREALFDPLFDPNTLATVGAALAQLHAQDPGGLNYRTREAEGAALLARASVLSIICPDLAGRAQDLAHRLATEIAREPPVNQLIHGDLHDKQVLLAGDAVALLDLDEIVRGDPAADLGQFIAHLERDALLGKLSLGQVEAMKAPFLQGYEAATGRRISSRLQLYVAAGLLKLAPHQFRHRGPDWPQKTEAILERATAILSGVRRH